MSCLIPDEKKVSRRSLILGYEWVLYGIFLTPLLCALMLPLIAWLRELLR